MSGIEFLLTLVIGVTSGAVSGWVGGTQAVRRQAARQKVTGGGTAMSANQGDSSVFAGRDVHQINPLKPANLIARKQGARAHVENIGESSALNVHFTAGGLAHSWEGEAGMTLGPSETVGINLMFGDSNVRASVSWQDESGVQNSADLNL